MLVNVGPIRNEQGASVPIWFCVDRPETVASQLDFANGATLTVDGLATNTGRGYLVEAIIRSELNLSCGRCLKSYRWSLETPLCERYFSTDEGYVPATADDDDDEQEDEADDIHHFSGTRFDLTAAVREQMLVSLPMKRICREECVGICSMCGTDLEEDPCDCREESVDIRMAPLAEWFAAHEVNDGSDES